MFKTNPWALCNSIERVVSRKDIVILESNESSVKRKKLVDEEEEQSRNQHYIQNPVLSEVLPEGFFLQSKMLLHDYILFGIFRPGKEFFLLIYCCFFHSPDKSENTGRKMLQLS